MDIKIVISDPKTGKSVQRELKDDSVNPVMGLKIGDALKGDSVGLEGFEFKITGGSDNAGFPMRKDVPGTGRKKILGIKGIGVNNKMKYRGKDMKGLRTMNGMRTRKTVAANIIYAGTAQINLMITKSGKENIFPEKPKEAKEGEAPAEKKAE
ncbi:MAG: 30S ribosomal protein S6e [Candidatus Woesearchaeota archaeon]|nr:30S ribosomal protein S6e [Candidatus Woesearchaeota archaeon]